MEKRLRGTLTGILAAVSLIVFSGFLSAETHVKSVAKPPKYTSAGSAQTSPAPSPSPSAVPQASPSPAPSVVASPVPSPSPSPLASPQPVATPSPLASPQPVATPTPAPTVATVSLNPILVALGSLGASNLYFSYLTLGTVADGFVSGAYDATIAVSIANEAVIMNTNAVQNLQNLSDSGTLANDDKSVVATMIETYGVLNQQAKALVQFISNSKDDGSQYQKFRVDAWSRISTLFGLK